MPTLAELLKPPRERLAAFEVGGREFDPAAVGIDTGISAGNRTSFDTTLPGNSNAGHLFGTELGGADKIALLEYLKSL